MIFIVFGIAIGMQFHFEIVKEFTSPYTNEIETQELTDLKKTTENMKVRIEDLKKQIDTMEKERVVESVPLQKLKGNVDEYKMIAGYTNVSGPGINIVLDSNLEENKNIAEIIEGRKYLVNLVNELKVFGAEVISINGNRLVSRSEIALAGNHINVHGKPIAPPYVIQAIGNVDRFKRYVDHGTIIFELMESNGIKSSIKFSNNIKIPASTKEKPMQFLKAVE
ncbi:protein of unknown function DUF881 [Alkaliphilus oremlandii OhILAs]|uniref:Division initiation protein n=2 Tax=Alkaliphilus oremlandii TaxID=461876 RepID=A8MIM5_ALKOO|nr:protein of unknown function DUF881 [Alkaliphilus oremlandii OhILAs]